MSSLQKNKAATALIDYYASSSYIGVTTGQKKAIIVVQTCLHNKLIVAEYMKANLKLVKEVQIMSTLEKKKSLGVDGIMNKMLIGLGTEAKQKKQKKKN